MTAKQRLCIVCRKRPAIVPDRNKMSSRIEVCRECHRERLMGDLRIVLAVHNKRRELGDDAG